MATVTYTELMAMQMGDLRKEILAQQTTVRKMRIGITMNKEKDSARYRREKRMLARMQTALTMKTKAESAASKETLKTAPKATTVPLRSRSKSAGAKPRSASKKSTAS